MEGMGGLGVYQRMSSIGQGKDRGGREREGVDWVVEGDGVEGRWGREA